MPIEFRCTACDKLLRTPDETAGKQAKCPECGALMQIPESSTAASSPFGDQPAPSPGRPGEPENPYQSPVDYAASSASALAPSPGPVVASQIGFEDVFRRAWRIFTARYGTALGVFLTGWAVNVAVNMVIGIVMQVLHVTLRDPALAVAVSIVGNAGTTLFSTWIGIGVALCFLKIARGREVSVGEVFSGGPYFLAILLATVLFMLMLSAALLIFILPATAASWLALANQPVQVRLLAGVGVGSLLGVIPCIVLSLTYSQYYYLILDRNLGITESLSVSRQITRGNRPTMFLIFLVFGILGGLFTIVTCGLGAILAVAPYSSVLMAVIYLSMTGQATADQQFPYGPGPCAPTANGSPFGQPPEQQPAGGNAETPGPNNL
jgi:uncharacterized membrane protein/phage FluMu protein Com